MGMEILLSAILLKNKKIKKKVCMYVAADHGVVLL